MRDDRRRGPRQALAVLWCDERLYLARSPLESGSSQRQTLRTKF